MFFARGQPVVYYGDEQGFTGDGGDKDAREDMFANEVPVYADNDLIGTDETSADDNFDRDHPLYQTIHDARQALTTGTRRCAPARRSTAYSSDGPGVYAFSRIDRDERIEYVVALNNSEAAATAEVPTYSPEGVSLQARVGEAGTRQRACRPVRTTGPGGALTRHRAAARVGHLPGHGTGAGQRRRARHRRSPASQHGDTAVLGTNSWDGHQVADRIEVRSRARHRRLWPRSPSPCGRATATTCRSAPTTTRRTGCSTTPATCAASEDTKLSFRAIVNDLSGHLAADEVVDVGVEFAAAAAPGRLTPSSTTARPAGDYGDHTTGNANDFWGLHLWGDAIAPDEATDWTSPEAVPRRGRVRPVRLREAGERHAAGELHRPPR